MNELYKRYRPRKFSQVVGNAASVAILKGRLQNSTLPHCLLFFGLSGGGKTTLARIVAKELGCKGQDLSEVNCADFRGIDTVRDIRQSMQLRPLNGEVRVWLVDECHKLSNDAQNALLKITEDTPSHVYFLFCTTDPEKLIVPLRNRFTQIGVKALSVTECEQLLQRVVKKEQLQVSEDVLDKIINLAEGSARRALVLLDQVATLSTEKEQLESLIKSDVKRQTIELCRLLLQPKPNWIEVAAVLKTIDEEPESVRYMILGYMRQVLLSGKGGNVKRAYVVIQSFRDNFYDSKHAGLAAACYEAAGA